ncbi:hypothetical protein BV25DRAFT_1915492 [Artomyces pyxidatus]|uniref:Uncharacterized protein n=1 Tax=Artomyces pyxidatus TaxID=48021 RepID=A0ACB8T3R8_9AGAM|nr:hypothetical protein BV25DRAFT_1915492 [Artomyces pyxidatus]
MASFSRSTHRPFLATLTCLITNVSGPPGSVFGTLLVHPSQLYQDTLSAMWGSAKHLFLDSPNNTVYLHEDWAQAAECSSWTFVPHPAMLARTLRALLQLKALKINASWDAIVPKQDRHTYVFLPLALGNTTITRKSSPMDTTPHGDPIPRELREAFYYPPPYLFPLSSMRDMYDAPYTDFPTLQHACHPYFVIYAAARHLQHRQPGGCLMRMRAEVTVKREPPDGGGGDIRRKRRQCKVEE